MFEQRSDESFSEKYDKNIMWYDKNNIGYGKYEEKNIDNTDIGNMLQ